jgi:hypothetical protein
MLRPSFVGALALLAVVELTDHLTAPPALVPVPASPVMYAPDALANYFAFGERYYVFTGGAWYESGGYDGPWVVIAPEFVPRPLLVVPVRYYHAPPPAWRPWRRDAAPRWEARWGRRWQAPGPSRARGHGPRIAHRPGESRHRY